MNIIDPAYPSAILAEALFIIKTEWLISVASGYSAVLFQSHSLRGPLQQLPLQLIKSREITLGSLEAISGFKSRL